MSPALAADLAEATSKAVDQIVRYVGIWTMVFVLLTAVVIAALGTPGMIFAVFPGTVLCSWLACKLA